MIEKINVFVLNENFELIEKVRAERATYLQDWNLHDGFVVKYPKETSFPEVELFSAKTGLIPEKPSDYKTLRVQEETMRLKDLRKYIARNKSYGLDTTGQQVNYHERVALIFAPLVFVLLAVAFALKPLKTQSMAKSIAFCFLIVFIYLVMFRMTLSIGKGGHIPPLLAGWTPNILFISLASVLILRRK